MPVNSVWNIIIVSSKSHIKTRSVVDSGVVGETVFVRRPRPLVLLGSEPKLDEESLDRLALSAFKGDVDPSVKFNPFDGLSVKIMLKHTI